MEFSGRYRLLRRLGEGGMGVVHEALDTTLGRRVAIKTIREAGGDAIARERFLREARAAAALSHPNACQLHEIGEHDGQPFLVMELLDGEPLSTRLLGGPLPPDEAATVMLAVLSALQALHARGLVHRDLKPSNVFLTPNGVKLLDFGLARPASTDATATHADLTAPGTLTGTPRYMAPEQLTGDPVTPRTDVYAAGVLFYELLTGHTPFAAPSIIGQLQSMLRDEPPPLGPSPDIAAFDAVVRRALQRDPQARYASAKEMAGDVGMDKTRVMSGLPEPPAIKLVVLPFRLLRPDQEVAFLEVALPDAITTSLSSLRALVVRSPLSAVRLGETPDLARVAAELDVNHVLTGTLLRAGDQIRATCQLVETPGDRVRWSQTVQTAVGDLFQLQDDIARHIVESLPIDGPAPRPEGVPASAHAYELYLRANSLAQDATGWVTARDLYQQCVAEDPGFAPAWARLGRTYRMIGKYVEDEYRASYEAAEGAFQRAFALNPDLSLAHHLYVYFEVDTGRADEALVRLVDRVARQPQRSELLAALCQAARYCGLLDVSLAAHERAKRLDPKISTSVAYTYMMLGDYRGILACGATESVLLRGYAILQLGGGVEEVVHAVEQETRRFAPDSVPARSGVALAAAVSGDRVLAASEIRRIYDSAFPDGEGIYNVVRVASMIGDLDLAADAFRRVVDAGFFCVPGFERDRWLEPLRGHPTFQAALDKAIGRHVAAQRAFETAGGYRLLELTRGSTRSSFAT